MSYKIYFKNDDGYFHILDNTTQKISIEKFQPYNCHSFDVFKGYEASEDGLRTFHKDFAIWCEELRDKKILEIEYTKYYSHHSAVEMTFKRLCKGKYEHHEPISLAEAKWSDMCNNGGLMYCNKGVHDCYGYDGRNFYASILASKEFKIPTKQGKEIILEKLPLKSIDLKVGYYKVQITCDDENFKKVFAYSQQHVYTHTSLRQAMINKKKFNVSIKLVQDGKSNAYLYDDSCIISGSDIFGKWYEVLNDVKKLYPKNLLAKHLQSSVWGHLTRTNRIHKTYEEVQEEGLNIGRTEKADYLIEDHCIFPDKEYYVLVDKKAPYKFNLRLKSFLTAFGRNVTAKVAMLDSDSVVRIQTDGVVFNKPMEMTDSRFIPEDKTTGKFEWKHVNKYEKLN